jgi:hypothetical protein
MRYRTLVDHQRGQRDSSCASGRVRPAGAASRTS